MMGIFLFSAPPRGMTLLFSIAIPCAGSLPRTQVRGRVESGMAWHGLGAGVVSSSPTSRVGVCVDGWPIDGDRIYMPCYRVPYHDPVDAALSAGYVGGRPGAHELRYLFSFRLPIPRRRLRGTR